MANLTAREVAGLTTKGRYHDGQGLYLKVGQNGEKSWVLRYWRGGKGREMGLGRVKVGADIKGRSLAEARMEATNAHRLLQAGTDPISERARVQHPREVPTFAKLVEDFVIAHEPSWRNDKTAKQFRSSLQRHAFPKIGSLPVDAISVQNIVDVLQPIQAKTPVMAERVRSQIAMVLDAAEARELRSGQNPAARRRLERALPKAERVRRPKHHEALPYAEVPPFLKALRKRDAIAARALEFTILTAARTAEVIGATWDEIDVKAKVWTIAGERMKSGRPHRVPLTGRALKVLSGLPREADNPHVFVGARRAKGLSNMAMLKLLWKLDPDTTVHGFRSSFRDFSSEQTIFPREVAEAALAHVVGDKTEAAYARSDLFEKRRALMEEWAAFCR